MPESVSHLIPERVGSMCLDKSKNLWIKNKESAPPPPVNVLPSDSEDDPFASIPDLSVDLTKELQNLKLTTARKESATADPEDCPSPTSPIAVEHTPARPGLFTFTPEEYLGAQAASAAGQESSGIHVSDLPSSDSVEDGEFAQAENPHVNDLQPTRRRNLTISFSSPVASIIREVQPEDLDSLDDDPESDGLEGDSVDMPGMTNKTKPVLKSARGTPRPLSSRDPNFHPRPVSRIDEQDEDSTVELPHDDQRQISIIGDTSMVSHKTPDGRRTSVSFILNGHPGNQALSVRGDDSAIISHNVGKLSLSPLSEFTLNNSDQSFGFEVSYVMGHRHMETGDGTKKVMSMTIRDLVDRLGEVEPFEPYWEDMEELDLQDKRLTSLHMLDEFCSKVVTLDASKNALGHLDGVPPTVRNLKVSENMLTELTAWDHLNNLQYIDISGNEVKSLSALKNLFHLRSIKADNNQLTSLDGLDCHDGLLSLRARNNLIEEVDFAFVKLERLSDLDLAGNEISSIQNLELLPALGRLKLSKNKLQQLSLKASMKTLRQLNVNDNELDRLDLSGMPNLHSLHADRNRISSIMGFNKARRLDSLSLREQRGEEPLDLGFLSAACEVRKLFLSGNYLRVFEPQVDFLNLQLLELANCGLQALPANIGQLMPNVRTLNLNFNAISDLSPLRFIPRLKKLVVAGNRLGDSTAVTELLTDFPHLAQLDLRDNPVTLGFYAPLQVLVSTKDGGEVDPFVLPPADAERDDLFAKRLDEATRLRRRLHQIVFAASCKRLRMLDGLPVKRSDVFAKDAVLIKLIDEGLLPRLDELNEDAAATSPRLTVSRPVEDEEEVAQEYDGEGTATRVPNGVSG
jgi:protein NUD1